MGELINNGSPLLGSQVSRLGLSSTALRDLVYNHRLRRVFRGVYVDAKVSDTRTLRCQALHLVMPACGVLFGPSAAWPFGVDVFPVTAVQLHSHMRCAPRHYTVRISEHPLR